MARLLRFAISATTAIAVAFLLLYGSRTIGFWPAGPLRDYLVRSLVLLPIVLGFVAAFWPLPRATRSTFVAGLAGAAIGLIYCYLATRVMFWIYFKRWGGFGHSVFLSPIAWDLDVEALFCGIVIGASAILLAIGFRSRIVLLTVAILVILGVLVPTSVVNLLTHNQELTVAVVTPRGASPVADSPEVNLGRDTRSMDADSMARHVLQSLRDAGIEGTYRVIHLYRQGRGKQVLAIIVMDGPVSVRTNLPEPRGADVIYLQGPSGWKTIPAQVRTVNRTILIWPPRPEDDDLGHALIFDASGSGSGFSIPRPSH